MVRREVKRSIWLWLALAVLGLTALLFWFEHLGSEQPVRFKEIPVAAPRDKIGLQN